MNTIKIIGHKATKIYTMSFKGRIPDNSSLFIFSTFKESAMEMFISYQQINESMKKKEVKCCRQLLNIFGVNFRVTP